MHISVGLCVQIPIIFGATLPAFYVYFRFALKGSGFPLGYMSFLHQSVQFLSGNYSLAYRISNYLFPDQLSPIGA